MHYCDHIRIKLYLQNENVKENVKKTFNTIVLSSYEQEMQQRKSFVKQCT